MITVYTIAYNEEIMLPFMIKWYRERFPDCKIVVYDNYSTDKTEKIALSAECQVIKYDSGNQIRDDLYLEIKNNCWKNAETDWVVICDVDELINITSLDLKDEKSSIIKFNGWNMVNNLNSGKLEDMKYGYRAEQYDKFYLFNKSMVTEINYEAGCHKSNPKGNITFSKNIYNCFHFKEISEDYIVNRYKEFNERLSSKNKQMNWGIHYSKIETEIRNDFRITQVHEHLKKLI